LATKTLKDDWYVVIILRPIGLDFKILPCTASSACSHYPYLWSLVTL